MALNWDDFTPDSAPAGAGAPPKLAEPVTPAFSPMVPGTPPVTNSPPPEAVAAPKTTPTNPPDTSAPSWDDFTPNPPPKHGAVGEIAGQAAASARVELPKMIGQAMQFMSKEGSPAYKAGTAIRQYGESAEPDYQPEPDAHNPITNALASGARMLAPSLAVGAGAAAAFSPLGLATEGEFTVPALLTGAVFGASQAQQTYESGIKAGLTPEKARVTAFKTGAIEAGGEAVGTWAGYKLFGLGQNALFGKKTVQSAIDSAVSTGAWKPFLKQLPSTAAVEAGTEFGQNYGESKVEENAGIQQDQSPTEQGMQGFIGALGMTALLAPFGLAGFVTIARHNAKVAQALQDPETDPVDRGAAAALLYHRIKEVDPKAAQVWEANTALAIHNKLPIQLDESSTQEQPAGPMSQAADVARATGAGPLQTAATGNRLFAFTEQGAITRAGLLAKQGQPQRIIPHPEREGRFGVIPDEFSTATDDHGRISALQKEANTIIDGIPNGGKAVSKGVIAHLTAIDEQLAELQDKVKPQNAGRLAEGKVMGEEPQGTEIPLEQRVKVAMQKQPFERTATDLLLIRQNKKLAESQAKPIAIPEGARTATVEEGAHQAATSPNNELPHPTHPQIEAGNYQKGHVDVGPLNISVENPEGSVRRSKPGAPVQWETTMQHHYGYFKGVPARAPDKEHVDAFVKPGTTQDFNGNAFVVDQNNEHGQFDEPKVMVGFGSQAEALKAYLSNYQDGWASRVRGVTALSMDDLNERLHDKKGFSRPQPDAKKVDAEAVAKKVEPQSTPKEGAAQGQGYTEGQISNINRLKKQEEVKKKIDTIHDSIIPAIAKLGGISMEHRLDIIGENTGNRSVPFVGHLFTQDGHGLDEMATSLGQYGYLTPEELDTVDGGVQALRDKIRDEFDGIDTHFSTFGEHERMAEERDLEEISEHEQAEIHEIVDEAPKPDNWATMTEEQKDEELDAIFGEEKGAEAVAKGEESRQEHAAPEVGRGEPAGDEGAPKPEVAAPEQTPSKEGVSTSGDEIKAGDQVTRDGDHNVGSVEEIITEPKELGIRAKVKWRRAVDAKGKRELSASVSVLPVSELEKVPTLQEDADRLRSEADPAVVAAVIAAHPARGEDIGQREDTGAEHYMMDIRTPKNQVAARANLSKAIKETKEQLEREIKRYNDLVTRKLDALSDYDITISSTNNPASALDTALGLVDAHISYAKSKIATLEGKLGGTPPAGNLELKGETKSDLTSVAEKKKAEGTAKREDKAIADRERDHFSLQPQTKPDQAPASTSQNDMFGGPKVADLQQQKRPENVPEPGGLFAQPEKQDAGAAWWNGLTEQQKLDAAVKAGWVTGKGDPNFVAKKLAKQSWNDISETSRETLTRKNEPAKSVTLPGAKPGGDLITSAAPTEYYQWMRNAEGGQQSGNQQTITPLTGDLYQQWIRPKLREDLRKQLSTVQKWNKHFGHVGEQYISLVKRPDGAIIIGPGTTGTLEDLRPTGTGRGGALAKESVEKGWVKQVDSFESSEAIAQAKTADSEREAAPVGEQPKFKNGDRVVVTAGKYQGEGGTVEKHMLSPAHTGDKYDYAVVLDKNGGVIFPASMFKREEKPTERPASELSAADLLRAAADKMDEGKKAAAAEKPAAPTSSDEDAAKKAKDDLDAALGDLGDIFGKSGRLYIVPEDEQKLMPVLSRLFDAAFRLGYYKFKIAAKFVLDTIRAKLGNDVADQITLDHLQGAYISMAGKYADKGADNKRDVVGVESLAELKEPASPVTPDITLTDIEAQGKKAFEEGKMRVIHGNLDLTKVGNNSLISAMDAWYRGWDKANLAQPFDFAKPDKGADNTNQEVSDVSNPNADLERDSPESATSVSQNGAAVPNGSGANERGPIQGGDLFGEGGPGFQSDQGVSADSPSAIGERSDQPVYPTEQSAFPSELAPGIDDSQRGDLFGGEGVEPERLTDEAVEDFARQSAKDALTTRAAQQKAESVAQAPGLENVRQTLPFLLPGQQEDVHFAEERFKVGHGVLFTNGTGTGKTYTGLGIIKRFARRGVKDILVIVPSDKIASDWVESGRNLKLDIHQLNGTTDNGGNKIAITTYANAYQNDSLAKRNWQLVIPDESHNLQQNAAGETTQVLTTFRALTRHPEGSYRYAQMMLPVLHAQIVNQHAIANHYEKLHDKAKHREAMDKLRELNQEFEEKAKPIREQYKQDPRAKVVMLSATPFAYEKNVEYAQGYLFEYPPQSDGGYNSVGGYDAFMQQHFGYRMRYNKLTQPDASVDRGLMQRQFNTWLKREKVISSRILDLDQDYDRKFVLIDSDIGNKIDEAITYVREQAFTAKGKSNGQAQADRDLSKAISDQFNYLMRRYVLEAIKAKEIIPNIKGHLDLGRKVVIYHDYKKGWGGGNPFKLNISPDAQNSGFAQAYERFVARFPELMNYPFDRLGTAIATLTKAFPDAIVYNGDIPAKQRRIGSAKFNEDNGKHNVLIIQSASSAGISLHDFTGKHNRVEFNLGLPTAPTVSIQQEGRIYRHGQKSNAMFRYVNTGTSWERMAFATTIAQRASAAENLALGEQARALLDAYVNGFENSDYYKAGEEGEGTGGKEADRAALTAISEYDRAKSFYWAQGKKTARNKAQEGKDYFATPEPIGLKMVEFLRLRATDEALEPSAGHGAIARWFPETMSRTAIEPSQQLVSKLALGFGGKVINDNFENHHIVNKYDGIAMNPPFGSAGRTAIDHLAKAVTHLRDGGRISAIIPAGPSADAKFDKWFYEEAKRDIKPLVDSPTHGEIYRGDIIKSKLSWAPEGKVTGRESGGDLRVKVEGKAGEVIVGQEFITGVARTGPRTETYKPAEGVYIVAKIELPTVAFERAGTAVRTRIVVLQKGGDGQSIDRDFSGIDDINKLFDAMENVETPLRPQPVVEEQPQQEAVKALLSGRGGLLPKAPRAEAQSVEGFNLSESKHIHTGATVYTAAMSGRVEREEYQRLNDLAKKHDGYYSKYRNNATGAVAGFVFKSDEKRAAFVAEASKKDDVAEQDQPRYIVNYELPQQSSANRVENSATAGAVPGVSSDLFVEHAVPDSVRGLAEARFATETRQLKGAGRFRSGIKKVEGPADAAHVFAPILKKAVEHGLVLVLNARKRPIAMLRVGIGARTQTSIYPPEIARMVHSIPGAKSVWFAHNHPSGMAQPSRADEMLTTVIADTLRDTGVHLAGHIVMGGTEAYWFDKGIPVGKTNVTAAYRKFKIPEVEFEIFKNKKLGKALSSPQAVREFITDSKFQSDTIIFVSAQNEPLATMPVNPDELKKLRTGTIGTGASMLMQAINKSNASAMIVYLKNKNDAFARNIAGFGSAMDTRVLDVFYNDGGAYVSMAEKGELDASRAFFSRAGYPTRGPDSVTIKSLPNGEHVFGNRSVIIDRPVRFNETKGGVVYQVYDTAKLREERAAGRPDDGAHVGMLEVDVTPSGRITGLGGLFINDELQSPRRRFQKLERLGYGEKVIRAILGSLPDGADLKIYGILPEARRFWEKMGATIEPGRFTEDGTITRQSYQSQRTPIEDGSGRSSLVFPGEERGAETAGTDTGRTRDYGPDAGAVTSDFRPTETQPSAGFPLLNPHDVESLRSELTAVLGSDPNALGIRTVGSWNELPQHLIEQVIAHAAYDAQGVTDPVTGNVYMIAANIRPGNAMAVYLHEVGVHKGLKSFIGEDGFNSLVDQVLAWAASDGDTEEARLAKAALARVPSSTDTEQLREEVLAYFVEEAVRAGHDRTGGTIGDWIRRLMEAVMSALRKLGGNPKDLTADDIVALARGAAEHSVSRQGEGKAAFSRAMFSRAGEDATTASSSILNRIKDLGMTGELAEDEGVLNTWNKTVGTPELVARKNPKFAKVFWEGQAYLNDINLNISRFEAMMPAWFKGQDILSRWYDRVRGKEVARAEKAAEALLDGTLKNQVFTDQELQARGLSAREIAMYDEARVAIDDILEKTGVALISKIAPQYAQVAMRMIKIFQQSGIQGLEDFAGYSENLGEATVERLQQELAEASDGRRQMVADRLKAEQAKLEEWQLVTKSIERIDNLQRQGYFPLSRFGRFYVNVMDPRGETVEFRMYESETLARVGAAQMVQKYPKSYQVQRGTISQDTPALFKGLTPESVELFAQITGMDTDESMQKYLKEAVANRSTLKRMIHRKGTLGYSKDAVRVLADFITSNSRYISRLEHFDNLTQYAHDIQGGALRDYAIGLVKYLRGDNGREEYQTLRGFLFFQYIGGNVSSALLNLSQVPMFTAPWLNQYVPMTTAGKLLKRGYQLAVRDPASIEGPLGDALRLAEDEGITNQQNVYTMMAVGAGSKLARIRAFSGLLDAWTFLFSKAEIINRRVTFIAAHELATARGLKGQEAFEFAAKAVRDTQFIYNKGNRPVWARGLGAIPFTFKLFTIQALETIFAKMPPRQAAILLAMMFVVAGGEGIPFAEDLEDLIDALGQKLGYTTNSKRWLAEKLQEAFHEWMGLPNETAFMAAEMARKGILANTPLSSMGSRAGMGNLIPATAAFQTGRDTGSEITQALGPVASFTRNLGQGAELFARGEFGRAGEKALPTGLANMLKGARQLSTGEETTPYGRRVSKVPTAEALGQVVGISSASAARVREREFMLKQDEAYVKTIRDRIADKWAQGQLDGDPEQVRQARQELMDFNARNPDSKIMITPHQIHSRVKNMRQDATMRIIKSVGKERRAGAREFLTDTHE